MRFLRRYITKVKEHASVICDVMICSVIEDFVIGICTFEYEFNPSYYSFLKKQITPNEHIDMTLYRVSSNLCYEAETRTMEYRRHTVKILKKPRNGMVTYISPIHPQYS